MSRAASRKEPSCAGRGPGKERRAESPPKRVVVGPLHSPGRRLPQEG